MIVTRCLLSVAFLYALLHLSHVEESQAAELTRYYCGKNLVQTLSLVCQSKYNKPGVKRYLEAYRNAFIPKLDDDYKNPSNFFNDLQLGETPDMFESEIPRYRIGKGVVDDCCYSPCSFSTLMLYCS